MIKAAIYGLGRWGNRLVDSVQGRSGKLVFVCGITRDAARHQEFATKAGITLATDYAKVLADPSIDAVVLATPHSQHHDQIVQAAQAGKHVYVEKPFTLTRASAESAVQACRTAGVTLGLGFNRRYAPAFVEMMKRIRAGEIGDVLHVEGAHSGSTGYSLKPGTWRADRTEAPAGGMTARGIHTLDAMIQIAGLVTSVYAYSARRKLPPEARIDDTTSMLLTFEGGATGYLSTVFVTGELWRVHVFGTAGWIEMRGNSELATCTLEGPAQRIALPNVDKEHDTLEAFADAIVARRPFMVPPEQAVNGIAVLEAIVASAASGKRVDL